MKAPICCKRWVRSSLLILAVVALVSIRASSQSLTPLYHWAYPNNGDQLYITDSSSPGSGWNYIEITGYVYTTQVDGTVQLARYYHPTYGIHFYTLACCDIGGGWVYEGPCCYVYNPQIVGTVPLFRYYDSHGIFGTHYYTTQQGGPGYPWDTYEGVEGYVSPP